MQTATTRNMIESTPKIDENCRLLISLSKDSGSIIDTQEIVIKIHRWANTLCIPKYISPKGVKISPKVTRYATEMPKQKIKMFTSTKIAT
jgi:hypothetical protein